MHLIPVKGGVLSSLALGPIDAQPAVMIHGIVFGNMATWYSSLAAPLSATHRVVLYDQRGHGDSPVAPAGYDLATQIDDLQAILSHHAIDGRPVDLVGHSMGAIIAMQFALRFPDRVRRLVLIDAPLPIRAHVLPDLIQVSEPGVLDGYIAEHRGTFSGRRLERIHRRLEQLFFHSTLVADLRDEPEPADASIARLLPPTLLVYGRYSDCLPAGRRLSRLVRGARLELLDSGHYVVEDAPVALRQVVIPFLEEKT